MTITGDFTKGTGDAFWFDFLGNTIPGVFDLVTWTGSTTFTDPNVFKSTNGLTGSFSFTGIGGNTLTFTAVPEPSSAILSGLLIGAGLLRRRRTA